MADVIVDLTPVPSAYTTFAEYVVAGYWDDGYVVSYACAYTVTGTANSVTSASSNVIPLGSNTAGTAILAATAGKFAMLQSNGTSWITMMAN